MEKNTTIKGADFNEKILSHKILLTYDESGNLASCIAEMTVKQVYTKKGKPIAQSSSILQTTPLPEELLKKAKTSAKEIEKLFFNK